MADVTTTTSSAPFRSCVVVPAFQAERTLAGVLSELSSLALTVIVVDDGSRDRTLAIAREHGAHVVRHQDNRGKGAALVTGMRAAAEEGFEVALTVDADGQHPADSARALVDASSDRRALVLGVRDLARDGAPRANRMSNGISNFFLSRFTRRALLDTQCGLRRYPIRETLALGASAPGYAFEAEILLRAIRAGIEVVQVPVAVRYTEDRTSHFDSVRDPARIIVTVLRTLASS